MKISFLRNTSIFTRIMLASLIPVILIVSILMGTISNTIFSSEAGYAREKTFYSIDYTVKMINIKFSDLSSRLAVVAENMLEIDRGSEDAQEAVTNMLLSLLVSDDDIYCARFVFHPGVFGEEMFAKDYINKGGNGEIIELFDLNTELLKNPEKFPWYYNPLAEKKLSIDSTNQHDFGIGEGAVYMYTSGYPIMENGEVIGVIAVDLLYSTMFKSIDSMQQKEGIQKIFMVSDKGEIIYPREETYYGKQLTDFPLADKNVFNTAIQNGGTVIEEAYSPFIDEKSLIYFSPLYIDNAIDSPFLYIDLPTSHLYADAYQAIKIIIMAGIAGLAVLVISIFFTTKSIAESVKRLTNHANEIANGRFDVEFEDINEEDTAKNEVSVLELSLSKMLKKLNHAHEMELMAMGAKNEKEKAEMAMHAKNKYFATMSHEIRTPMNAVLGMSELLIAGTLDETQNKYARNIKNSAEELLSIINGILDMSKIEDDSFTLNPIHYDFIAFIENINFITSFLAEKKGLLYESEMSGDIPRCLYGDDIRLRQVLINITGNAVKYTKKGTIRFRITDEGENLRFDISDTGEGIKPESLAVIFDPYLVVGNAESRYTEGTGLGLDLSKKLVESMDGIITVDSVYGKGSTFSIIIPKTVGDASKIEKDDDSCDTWRAPSMKVLVVDDNQVNLSIMEGLLGLYNINCDLAPSGKDAIKMIQNIDYDIVFMDHMMPDMDGVQAAQNIRAMGGKYEKLTIVALTANASESARKMFLSSGMNDFLAKPVEKKKLYIILNKWAPEGKNNTVEDNTVNGTTESFASDLQYSPMITQISKIPGIDVKLAIEQMAGMQRIYENALRVFNDDLPDHIEKLRQTLDKDDHANLTIQVHGMKSVLIAVGAVEMHDKALNLEKALKTGDDEFFKANIDSFLSGLDVLYSQISSVIGR